MRHRKTRSTCSARRAAPVIRVRKPIANDAGMGCRMSKSRNTHRSAAIPATEDLYRCFHERVCGAVLAIALYATYLIAKSQSLPPTPGTTSWKTSWSIVSFALGPVVNLIYSKAVDRGGHFAAWEQPQVFLEELRASFRSLRFNQASTTRASQR